LHVILYIKSHHRRRTRRCHTVQNQQQQHLPLEWGKSYLATKKDDTVKIRGGGGERESEMGKWAGKGRQYTRPDGNGVEFFAYVTNSKRMNCKIK
jgi:hypothetical protein